LNFSIEFYIALMFSYVIIIMTADYYEIRLKLPEYYLLS